MKFMTSLKPIGLNLMTLHPTCAVSDEVMRKYASDVARLMTSPDYQQDKVCGREVKQF